MTIIEVKKKMVMIIVVSLIKLMMITIKSAASRGSEESTADRVISPCSIMVSEVKRRGMQES